MCVHVCGCGEVVVRLCAVGLRGECCFVGVSDSPKTTRAEDCFGFRAAAAVIGESTVNIVAPGCLVLIWWLTFIDMISVCCTTVTFHLCLDVRVEVGSSNFATSRNK